MRNFPSAPMARSAFRAGYARSGDRVRQKGRGGRAMMLSVSGLLSQDDLQACRQILAAATWEDGRQTAGYLAAGVKSNAQLPLDSPAAKQLGELILVRLGQCPTFIAAALPLRVLPPRFNRHEDGGAYGNHIDNALFRMPGSDDYVRADVSCTVFLNDPEEYEGGELWRTSRQAARR